MWIESLSKQKYNFFLVFMLFRKPRELYHPDVINMYNPKDPRQNVDEIVWSLFSSFFVWGFEVSMDTNIFLSNHVPCITSSVNVQCFLSFLPHINASGAMNLYGEIQGTF